MRPLPTLVALLALPALALAHEDDPKVLDRQAPYRGSGYRNALVANPGGNQLPVGGGTSFASEGVTLLAWLPLGDFGADLTSGNDCWGYVSPSGREYALFGHSHGTGFVEITVPGAPVIVANHAGPGSLWRDVKVYSHHAYVVSEGGGGIQVFDLGQIDQGLVTLVNQVNDVGTGATHNVAIDTARGLLARTGGSSNGLRLYDLANPAAPAYVGSWSSRYVHDAQLVTYESGPYAGRTIAFACSGFSGGYGSTGLSVLDVTDPANVLHVGQAYYPNPAYSHQAWLSEDRRYLYLNDELDEGNGLPTTTHIIDVSDIANPTPVGSFTNGNPAVGHNIYVRGNLIYEANYRSGMRVFDAADPLAPVEVAWFDTYPADDAPSFNGLWSVYPYFPSGTVVGSDLERGLFVWRVEQPRLRFEFTGGVPGRFDPGGDILTVDVVELVPGALLPGSVRLHLDLGAGFASLPMSPVGGSTYQAALPPGTCGESLLYYLTAQSDDLVVWAHPAGAPGTVHAAVYALGELAVVVDEMEAPSGWTVGAPDDDATTGIWVRVAPNGTAAQPGQDHTPPPGTHCWVTGQGSPGGSLGEADVDNGKTTLFSPVHDVAGLLDPHVSYWRWYSNDSGASPNADVFVVGISNDAGASWTVLETVGPAGPQTSGGWFQHRARLRDIFPQPDRVQLYFEASDYGAGSIVEAAVDDFSITDLDCGDCNGNGVPDQLDIAHGTSQDLDGDGIPDECQCQALSYCSAAPNSAGPGALLAHLGSTSHAANDLVLTATGGVPGQFGLFFYGTEQIQAPFGNGFRCVGDGAPGIFRLNPPLVFDPLGGLQRPLDLTQAPASGGPGEIGPGSTWNFQFWYRDPAAGGAGFNLSDALRATFCP